MVEGREDMVEYGVLMFCVKKEDCTCSLGDGLWVKKGCRSKERRVLVKVRVSGRDMGAISLRASEYRGALLLV